MASTKPLTIKKYISPLTSVARSEEQNTLGSVLSLVRSSHDAVFIFNDDKEFLGLISPLKTLYSRNFPYTTKVSSIVFKPPAITKETPVYQVAKYMLSAKMYVLPVFSKEGDLQSVIHGKDILQGVIKSPSLLKFVSSKVKPRSPIVAPITASVKDVFYDLKEKGVSRMILVDDGGALAGIVTRSDLMRTLIKPTSKMRFPNEGSHMGLYSLAGEKKFRKSEPVRKHYTARVNSLADDTPRAKILKHLISSPHDSVVLVDKYNKPTGFLSTRDILQAIKLLQPEKDVPLSTKKPSDIVSTKEQERATKHLETFGRKLKKRIKIGKIEVTSDEIKNTRGHSRIFNITVKVTPTGGKPILAVTKQRKYIDGIQEATKLIEEQLRRRGL